MPYSKEDNLIQNQKNEQGSALVLVLIMMLIMTVLGTSLLATAQASTKMTIYQENSMKAYFLAESGAKAFADYIIDTPAADIANLLASKETENVSIGGGSINLELQETDGNLIITANGLVNGVSNHATVVLEKVIGNIFDYTVLSLGDISIANHVTVIGDVATNSGPDDVSTAPNASPQKNMVITNAGISIPSIEVPTSYDQVFSTKVTGGETIPVSGDIKVHLSEGVALSNKKNLTVTGNGTLHLFVSKGWQSANHTQLNVSDDVTLYLYMIDSSDVYIRSNKFKGTIYAPNSNVTFHNASGMAIGGRNFLGSIIAKEVNLDGNHTTIERDSAVDYSNIKISKSYKIKGWQ